MLDKVVMWRSLFITGILLEAIIYLMSSKENCACGVRIPEGGGMCDCGEYNGRMTIKIDGKDELRERELNRIEDEKNKGNSYDTFL